jgi:hypothetical protein
MQLTLLPAFSPGFVIPVESASFLKAKPQDSSLTLSPILCPKFCHSLMLLLNEVLGLLLKCPCAQESQRILI